MLKSAPDWLRRSLRTFIDTFITTAAILLIPQVLSVYSSIVNSDGTGSIDIDLNAWGNLLLACVIAASVAVFNGAKNAVEDKAGKSLIVEK